MLRDEESVKVKKRKRGRKEDRPRVELVKGRGKKGWAKSDPKKVLQDSFHNFSNKSEGKRIN